MRDQEIDETVIFALQKTTELTPEDFSAMRAYILRDTPNLTPRRVKLLNNIKDRFPQFWKDTILRN